MQHSFSRRALAALFVIASTFAVGLASATHDRGLVELDGNVADAASGLPYDWATLFGATGAPLVSAAPVRVSAFAADHGAPDATYHDGSDKDIEDITTWQCAPVNSPQDKTDLLNGYAAAFLTASGGEFLYFGLERATNNGNSFVGVWFLQNGVGCTAPAGGSGTFTRGHTVGDLLVLSDFTGGGSVSSISVYQWDPSAPNNLRHLRSAADCTSVGAGDAVCGRVNGGSLATPWAPGNARALASNTFLEGGIDLRALLPPGEMPCFSQFMVESRSSQELTAQLKDYALGSLATCDARIRVTPTAATNLVGDPHTFTFTVEGERGAGWYPIAGQTVTASIASGPGGFVGAPTCTTDALGQCSVTIVSSTSGATTLVGAVDVVIAQTQIHRETDGTGASSGPAVKTWLKIDPVTTSAPSLATLALGGSLTDTVTVTGSLHAPTGDVAFFVCGPDELVAGGCPSGGASVGTATLVDGAATSPAFTPTRVGDWCFRADYLGDATYHASTDGSVGECFVVTRGEASISTTSVPNLDGVARGASVADSATVAGPGAGFPVPTGEIAFHLCGPSEVTDEGCPAGGAAVGTATLDASGAAVSPSTSATIELGRYCWRVEYEGDATYLPASHTNGDSECFVVRHVELSLAKAASVAEAEPGDEVTYTLTLTASGNTPATGVAIMDAVPVRSTLVDCGACVADGSGPGALLRWDVGSLGAPGSVDVSFTVVLDDVFPAGTTIVPNVAAATSEQTGELGSNEIEVAVVGTPALALEKRVGAPGGEPGEALDAAPGDEAHYVLTLRSTGNAPASDIVVRDVVPARSTLLSCSGCTYEGAAPGDAISWSVATLAPGESVDLSFRVRLDASFPAGTTVIPNVATVDSDGTEPASSNEVLVSVLATADLGLVKSVDVDVASEGDLLTFRLVAYNAGNGDAASATLRDPVPEGTEFVSCTGDCVESDGVIAWQTGPLAAHTSASDAAASVLVTVRVLDAHGCAVCNAATIESDAQPDATIESNVVCVDLVPDLDRATGAGSATALRALLGADTLAALGEVAGAQTGAGDASDAREEMRATLPEGAPPATAGLLRAATSASVAAGGASTLSYAEVVDLDVLGGAITASKVRAVAAVATTSGSATFSSAGTTVQDLRILGVLHPEVAPGTRLALPAEIFGEGSHVLVGAGDGESVAPATPSGGLYEGTLEVFALRIHLADADPVTPGAQPLLIEVARASASATFPQETPCEPVPTHDAQAGSAVLVVGGVALGGASAPEQGGADGQALAALDVGVARAGASTSAALSVPGEEAASSAAAQTSAVCLLPGADACAVSAGLVRAQANARAGADGASADGEGTHLVDLRIQDQAVALPTEPGAVLEVPGVGFLVVDERVALDDGILVRGLRLVVTEGPLAGTQVVVAEAQARAG